MKVVGLTTLPSVHSARAWSMRRLTGWVRADLKTDATATAAAANEKKTLERDSNGQFSA
jgi:hypothetical protein